MIVFPRTKFPESIACKFQLIHILRSYLAKIYKFILPALFFIILIIHHEGKEMGT